MNKFYVFLDVSGVLNNYTWFQFYKDKNLNKKGYDRLICPYNLKALNELLNKIEINGFEPIIVITSTLRLFYFKKITNLLIKNNINYSNKFYETSNSNNNIRGLDITKFIEEKSIKENYVVVDDEIENIVPHIPHSHIIKASGMLKGGLTTDNIYPFIYGELKSIKNKFENEFVKEKTLD